MTQKYAIEVDFDVYRALWLRRKSEETTFNDVLRELLALGEAEPVPRAETPSPPTPLGPLKGTGYRFRGRWQPCQTAKEVLTGVLRDLAREDAQFPSRLAAVSNVRGRKRRYVAQRAEDLYPGRPDLANESVEFASGWCVGTNISNDGKTRLLQDACQASGLQWGKDLVITLG